MDLLNLLQTKRLRHSYKIVSPRLLDLQNCKSEILRTYKIVSHFLVNFIDEIGKFIDLQNCKSKNQTYKIVSEDFLNLFSLKNEEE